MTQHSENTKTATCDNNVLANRFYHTLENCLFAQQELIKLGLSEIDFYLADENHTEIGFLIGEPMLKTDDDFCKSALDMYKEKMFVEETENLLVKKLFKQNKVKNPCKSCGFEMKPLYDKMACFNCMTHTP